MFRIDSLKVYNHKILKSFELDFSNENNLTERDNIFITTIIGVNGVGKSYILRVVAEIFNIIAKNPLDVDDLLEAPGYFFEVKYQMDGHHCMLRNFADEGSGKRLPLLKITAELDGKTVSLRHLLKPQRIVASTMTVNDKFIAKSNEVYRYQGIRQEEHPNATGSRTIVRKTVKCIINSLRNKENFSEELTDLLVKMELEPHLELRYNMRYKQVFFDHASNPEQLLDVFHHWQKYFPGRQNEVWGSRYFRTIENDRAALQTICAFITKVAENSYPRSAYVVRYNLPQEAWKLGEDADALHYLTRLDLLTYPELKAFKKQEYNFMDGSSGETQLLCQMLGMMGEIRDNSLVLIDEPEASLHPNWQMNYVDWLKSIFKKYKDCHFVVSTHSHFLLTNLTPEDSAIIVLKREDSALKNVASGANGYCWSTDEILYRIFHVRNTRNWAFERAMQELYKMVVNKRRQEDKFYTLLEELSGFVLSPEDPLNHLLEFARGNETFE